MSDDTYTLLLNAACNRLNPIAGTNCTADSDKASLAAMADAVDALPDSDFPRDDVSLVHARQLTGFLRGSVP